MIEVICFKGHEYLSPKVTPDNCPSCGAKPRLINGKKIPLTGTDDMITNPYKNKRIKIRNRMKRNHTSILFYQKQLDYMEKTYQKDRQYYESKISHLVTENQMLEENIEQPD